MLSPIQLHDAVRHERELFSDPFDDGHALCDRVAVVCAIAAALRRYTADHQADLHSSALRRVGRALRDLEREVHWLALCGRDANELELLAAVTSALTSAELVTAILRTDVSGAFMERAVPEKDRATPGRFRGVEQ